MQHASIEAARGVTESQTILVVEGDTQLRGWMSRSLQRCGYAVVEAPSAEAGLSQCSASPRPIDLAIVDMILPGLAGLDLAAELGRSQPDLPILYTSGCVHSLAMEVIQRQAPEQVLLKPFRAEELRKRVRRLMPPREAAQLKAS